MVVNNANIVDSLAKLCEVIVSYFQLFRDGSSIYLSCDTPTRKLRNMQFKGRWESRLPEVET